jgi:hypothetical protein
MTIEPLGIEEAAANAGATHKVTITFRDLTDADTSQVITGPVTANGQTGKVLRLSLETPFDDAAGSLSGLTVAAADDSNTLLATQEIAADGTEVYEKYGSNTTTYTAADSIDFTFTATGANLNTLNKGKLVAYCEIRGESR